MYCRVRFHCMKSVRSRSYPGSYIPSFGLNTERCVKIRTRKTPNMDTFNAVFVAARNRVFIVSSKLFLRISLVAQYDLPMDIEDFEDFEDIKVFVL